MRDIRSRNTLDLDTINDVNEYPDLISVSGSKLRAADIKQIMDKKVIGQEEAKERLSILISMLLSWDYKKNPMHSPPHGIIVGPTGSGKTFSIQVASAELGIPFVMIDSTTLVPSGATQGLNVDELDGIIRRNAEGKDKCIVFLDEFDKIAQKSADRNAFWKADIQKGLLKFIEGQKSLSGFPAPRVLFFAGGAFQDIHKLERERQPDVSRLLRSAPKGTIVADDLINFGFLPELIARMPAIIQYERLPEDALLQILQHPESSPLIVWQNHFKEINKSIVFSDGFMREVARRSYSLGLGARGLQQIVFPALSRRAYALESSDDNTIKITENILRDY